jgi:TonB family protein
MNSIQTVISKAGMVLAAAAVTAALFVAIPVIHGLFGVSLEGPAGLKQKQLLPIENLPPPKKEEKKLEERLRQVKNAAMDKAIAGSERAMAMKFTPDLSVEGSANGASVAMQGQDLKAEVFEEGQTDENPVPIFTPAVEYPERAREQGIQGVLKVEFIIDISGRVQSVTILESPHPSISAEARKTIAQWRFKPARNKGVPVRVRRRLPIEFKIE